MDKIITHTVRLHCNTHRAFQMFTLNEYLQSWLAPLTEVEPEVGGKYELFWNPTDPMSNSTIGCKVTAIVPDKLLAFEWKGPEQFKQIMNDVDPLTHVIVFFLPSDELFTASTDVYLVHTGWRNTPGWDMARRWFIRAWENAFEELQRQVNN